jgi:hypothetical protein
MIAATRLPVLPPKLQPNRASLHRLRCRTAFPGAPSWTRALSRQPTTYSATCPTTARAAATMMPMPRAAMTRIRGQRKFPRRRTLPPPLRRAVPPRPICSRRLLPALMGRQSRRLTPEMVRNPAVSLIAYPMGTTAILFEGQPLSRLTGLLVPPNLRVRPRRTTRGIRVLLSSFRPPPPSLARSSRRPVPRRHPVSSGMRRRGRLMTQ